MEKLFNWIRAHKSLTIIIIISLFLLPLIMVHCLFKINFKIPLFEAEWTAGDVLNYIVGFEASIATIVLSFVALYQTEKFKKSEQANIKRPFFIIDKVTVKEDNQVKEILFKDNAYQFNTKTCPMLNIYLKNVGDGIANNFTYEPYTFLGKVYGGKPSLYIPVQGTHIICRMLGNRSTEPITEIIKISYQNILGFSYEQEITTKVQYYNMYHENEDAEEEYYITNIKLISPQVPIC